MATIEIPLQGEAVLEVELKDLQGNDEAIIDILKNEKSAPSLFLKFAFEYKKRGMVKEFETFLTAGNELYEKQPHRDEEWATLLLLNTLASFYIEKNEELRESEQYDNGKEQFSRDDLLLQATKLVNRAEQIDRMDTLTLLLKAKINISHGKLNDAIYLLQGALSKSPNSIPVLAGLATTHYLNNDFASALSNYQQILKRDPEIQPDIRIPIGVCYAHLNMPDQARYAFKQALARNPDNPTAIALLSAMDFNESRSKQDDRKIFNKKSMSLLIKGFKLDPRHPLVDNQLAERLLGRKSVEKALVLAETGLKHGKSKALRAESLTLKGRLLQADKQYDEAFDCFKEAVDLNSKSTTALFGYAQMCVYKRDLKTATTTLEKVLRLEVNSYETRRILASLYVQLGDRDKAQQHFGVLRALLKSYEEEDRLGSVEGLIRDPDMLSEMAVLAEREDLDAALGVYSQLLARLQELNANAVPPELLNNMAVLHHLKAERPTMVDDEEAENKKSAALQNAESLYQRALVLLQSQDSDMEAWKRTALQVTIRFNVARLYESKKDFFKAVTQHNEILKLHPANVDCHIRLGVLELSQGKYKDAIDKFSDALAIDPKNIDAWNLVAQAHIHLKQYKSARKSYEKVLRELDRHDIYALCGNGNLCLRFALDDPKQADLHLKRAVEFFSIALRQDPGCWKACNGLGIAHAQAGFLQEALEIFNQLQGIPSYDLDIMINTAHCLMDLDKPTASLAFYEAILKKTNSEAEKGMALKALARANYIIGRTNQDPEALKRAQTHIERAAELHKEDKTSLWNLGLIKQQYASVLNSLPTERRHLRSIAALEEAKEGLQDAARIMKELAEDENPKGFTTKQALERAKYSEEILKVTMTKLHNAEKLEKQNAERLEQIQKRQEELKKEREEMEKVKQLEEEEKRKIANEKRLELSQKQALINERMRQQAEQDSKRVRHDSDSDGEKK
ncbi:hypothetical protein EDD86DRAFT_198790 [Gorgonomyces haynaldii]|nr:hypothetical protein EDD86DRAFT_198790 [Gorgonomyces haynaldii]